MMPKSESQIRREGDIKALEYLVDCIENSKPIRLHSNSHEWIVSDKEMSRYLLKKKLKQYKDHIELIKDCIKLSSEIDALKIEISKL